MVTGDPYGVLGVRREATTDEIKAAYEQKVNAAARSGAIEVVQRLDAAYEVLRNSHRRCVLDRTGQVINVPRIAWTAAPTTPGRNWALTGDASGSAARPGGHARRVLVLMLLALVAVAGWQSGALRRIAPGGTRSAAQLLHDDLTPSALHHGAGPPIHYFWHPKRLLSAVKPPPGEGGFASLSRVGAAVRWDPCHPIEYVVSGPEPFPGANALLGDAISEVSRDSGLLFRYTGGTAEQPTQQRKSYQPSRYGNRWAPVLVAWTTPTSVPALAGPVVGVAGPGAADVGGHMRYVSGTVYLDAPQLSSMHAESRTDAARDVVLHEFGHLVGLGHVSDPDALMAPAETSRTSVTEGDLRGFAAMGAGPCFTSD